MTSNAGSDGNTNAVLLSSMVLAVARSVTAPPPPVANVIKNATSAEVNRSAARYFRVKNDKLLHLSRYELLKLGCVPFFIHPSSRMVKVA